MRASRYKYHKRYITNKSCIKLWLLGYKQKGDLVTEGANSWGHWLVYVQAYVHVSVFYISVFVSIF
jgi:hypothetical protein